MKNAIFFVTAVLGLFVTVVTNYWIYIPAIIDYFKYENVKENRPIHWKQGHRIHSDLPNIVFILVDDLGFNDITAYGGGFLNGTIQTPHIDSIGRNGALFKQGYAGHATCAPSRASLLTGKYPTQMGFEFTPVTGPGAFIIGNFFKNKNLPGIYHSHRANDGLRDDSISVQSTETTIGDVLSQDIEKRYKSLFLGKWHNGNKPDFTPDLRGFDEYLAFNIISLYLPLEDPNSVNCPLDDVLDRFLRAAVRYQIVKDDSPYFAPKGYLTDYLAEEAAAAIQANKDNPFFMYLSFTAVHTPLQALRSDYEKLAHIEDHCARVYAAMLMALDRGVGTVLRALEDNGLADNTMVIFTSDNGAPSYINQAGVNFPFRGWKGTLFEGGIRVPLMMQWPRHIQPGVIVEDVVSHVDIFPTIAAAAGVTIQHRIDGHDLIPLVKSDTPSRAAVPPEMDVPRTVNSEVEGDGHHTLFWRSGHYMALRHGHWKVQQSSNPLKIWLYDLRNDVGEHHNLVDSQEHSEILHQMLLLLREVNASQKMPLWPALSESPILLDKFFTEPYMDGDEYIYWPN